MHPSPSSSEIARRLFADTEHAIRHAAWVEIPGDDPEAAALAQGWTIDARHRGGVIAQEPGARWAVFRRSGRTIALLAAQLAGHQPSLTRLWLGSEEAAPIVILRPPPGWQCATPGMYGRNGVVVHVEELDDEVIVAMVSSRKQPSAEVVASVAREFAGAGAEVVSRVPIAAGGHLRYVRFVAMRSAA
jgi:hypothetical protein